MNYHFKHVHFSCIFIYANGNCTEIQTITGVYENNKYAFNRILFIYYYYL